MEYSSITANLMVADVNATVDFYRDVLGFGLVVSVPDSGRYNWAMMSSGGATLMFQSRESLIEELPQLADRLQPPALTLYAKVTGLDEVIERVRSAGVLVKEPYVTFYNAREIVIEDPNGYFVALAEDVA